MSKSYYQPHGGKLGAYTLRDNTYRRMWYLIADYGYFKRFELGELEFDAYCDELYSKPEIAAISKANFKTYITAIEDAQRAIPEDMVEPVMKHIVEKACYKDIYIASEGTLKLWTQRFIWHVAKNLGEI